MARLEDRSWAVDRRALSDCIKMREVVGIFRSKAVENAVDSLMLAGINPADIDLIGDIETLERRVGGVFTNADVPGLPRRLFPGGIGGAVALSIAAGISGFVSGAVAAQRVIASGGEVWVAAGAAILCSLVGGGISAWLAYHWLKARFKRELDRQIAAMGVVTWVRVRSPEKEEIVLRTLRQHRAEGVGVHEFEIGREFEGMPLRELRPNSLLPEGQLGTR